MDQKRAAYAVIKQRRAAYAAFEKTILDLYDRKFLTLDRLDRVANQYRWLKIDNAGSQHLLTRDGKDLCQVCIELVDPSFSIPLRGSSDDHEEYWEQEFKKWEDIVRWRWEWHAYGVGSSNQSEQSNAA
jgi:hypothetical protein